MCPASHNAGDFFIKRRIAVNQQLARLSNSGIDKQAVAGALASGAANLAARGAGAAGRWFLKAPFKRGFGAYMGYTTLKDLGNTIDEHKMLNNPENPMLTQDGHAKSRGAVWTKTLGNWAWLPLLAVNPWVGIPLGIAAAIGGNLIGNSMQNKADKNYAKAMQSMYDAGLDPTQLGGWRGESYDFTKM